MILNVRLNVLLFSTPLMIILLAGWPRPPSHNSSSHQAANSQRHKPRKTCRLIDEIGQVRTRLSPLLACESSPAWSCQPCCFSPVNYSNSERLLQHCFVQPECDGDTLPKAQSEKTAVGEEITAGCDVNCRRSRLDFFYLCSPPHSYRKCAD